MTTAAASVPVTVGRGLHVSLWVVQALLALAFLGAGFMKVTTPIAELATQMSFVTYTPAWIVRLAGTAEVLGALGLILPSVTRILPVLTPVAGAGLALVMLLATVTHLTHGEAPMIVPNLVLGTLAAFVAWGRFKQAPIAPR